MQRYKGLHGEKSLPKSPSSPVLSSEATNVTSVLSNPSEACLCVCVHTDTHAYIQLEEHVVHIHEHTRILTAWLT